MRGRSGSATCVDAPDYRLLVTGPAQRALDRLPAAAAAAVAEFLVSDPLRYPHRVGKALRGELRGTWSARRGPYRVGYAIDEQRRVVAVLRIEHRAHDYRRR